LAELWGKAKEQVKGKVVAKVVDEMWTYLYKNTRAFTSGFSLVTCTQSWEFTSFWGMGMRVLFLRSKSICLKRGER
jgi:hypothetical protein